jgi:hypothetical protein
MTPSQRLNLAPTQQLKPARHPSLHPARYRQPDMKQLPRKPTQPESNCPENCASPVVSGGTPVNIGVRGSQQQVNITNLQAQIQVKPPVPATSIRPPALAKPDLLQPRPAGKSPQRTGNSPGTTGRTHRFPPLSATFSPVATPFPTHSYTGTLCKSSISSGPRS